MQPAPGGGYRSLEINNPANRTAPVLYGYGANWAANSPSPLISIVGAYTPLNTVFVDCYLHTDGFTAEYFWGSGTQAIDHVNGCNSQGYGYGTGINISFAPSSSFGWGAGCWLASSCSTSSSMGSVLGVQGVRMTAQENSGPSVVADGGNNLWYQGGHWIRGGGWPVTFTASDPSGVCGTDLLINGQPSGTDSTSDTSPDTSSFTQCWPSVTPTGTLDTGSFANGPLTIDYQANNAAGVVSAPTETLQVDNTPVRLWLVPTNDADPNVWVNHAVTLLAAALAGPSGIGGIICSTNEGRFYGYPSRGITLNGTGVWKVACSGWNNALDVNGQPANAPAQTVSVHIDETAPTLAFAPANSTDPQAVMANTSDRQSGVSGGQVQIRPQSGGSWQSLATTFDGSHLVAHFNDATLAPGKWLVQAMSCDHAGNCASTDETVTLPVRNGSSSSVSFSDIKDPLKAHVVKKRVRVGWHWVTIKRHGNVERVKRGGHVKTVRIVKYTERCSRKRVKVGSHHWQQETVCHKPRLILKSREHVRHGRSTVIHGLLTTAQGVPITNAPISVMIAPDNGLFQYGQAAVETTNSRGEWAVTLPAGPSRLINAVYNGSPTIQPSQSSARLAVSAQVKVLRIWPRHVAWGGSVHIKAKLVGGYLPRGGALVRLRLGYGNARITYGVQEHVGGNGTFEVTNTFGVAPAGVIRSYWLQECTLPESDYPFAPACGPRNPLVVGGQPAAQPSPLHRKRRSRRRNAHSRA